jgi:hypothetical protein
MGLGGWTNDTEECGFPPSWPGDVEPVGYEEAFTKAYGYLTDAVDVDFLKLAFNSLLMYYTDTSVDYPEHSVNVRLLSFVGSEETLLEWSSTLRTEFMRRNAAGLPMSLLCTGEAFNVSSKTFIDHLKSQNSALVTVNKTVTDELHRTTCRLDRALVMIEEQSKEIQEQSKEIQDLKALMISNHAQMMTALNSVLKKRGRVSSLRMLFLNLVNSQ